MKARIPEELETERLQARRLRLGDEPELRRLEQDPRVWPTLWPWPPGPSDGDVRTTLTRHLTLWERDGLGPWLLRDRSTGETVGRGGLQPTAVSGTWEIELAWAIVPARWGEGLATELGQAAIAVGFAVLRLPALIAVTLPDNAASRRVMEKAGLRYERDVRHAGLAHVLYRRRRADADADADAAASVQLSKRPHL